MPTETSNPAVATADVAAAHGSGSVAHQIIGEFLTSLQAQEGYDEIAKNLRIAIFDGKPTEAALRSALFGEEPL